MGAEQRNESPVRGFQPETRFHRAAQDVTYRADWKGQVIGQIGTEIELQPRTRRGALARRRIIGSAHGHLLDNSTTRHNSTARQVCSWAASINGAAAEIPPALDSIVADRNDIAMILETAKMRACCRDFAGQHFIDPLGSDKFVEPVKARLDNASDPNARSSIHEYVQELQ
jgi:hypothetical protein